MATSGSVNFNLTRNQIIYGALKLLGAYSKGKTVSASILDDAQEALNMIVKEFQGMGLHIWAREEAVLFISKGIAEYDVGNNARCCLASDAVLTELSSAASATDTNLTVDSTTGMAANDVIGIVLDDDTIDWTTISSVDSSTTLTIASGLSSAAAVDNNIYTYTSTINKPLYIEEMRRVTGIDNGITTINRREIPIHQVSHAEYFEMPDKTRQGEPSQFHYSPDLTSGKIYLWQTPNDPEMYFRFTFHRMIEDFDSATDNPDFPSEWLRCLKLSLAADLALEWSKYDKLQALKALADESLYRLMNHGADIDSFKLIK